MSACTFREGVLVRVQVVREDAQRPPIGGPSRGLAAVDLWRHVGPGAAEADLRVFIHQGTLEEKKSL